MFVKVTTPDNTVLAINVAHVRAIQAVTPSRSNILFANQERAVAVSMGIDAAIEALTPKTSTRATRKNVGVS
jgi:hypothetical protein